MRTPCLKQLCSFALIAMLALPAVPASAGTPAAQGDFDLRLEEALALQGSSFGLTASTDEDLGMYQEPHSDEPEAQQIRLTKINPEALEEVSWQNAQAGDDSAGQLKRRYGFGRWVKKRWYVVVLAAVAVGVLVSDDDDGPNDTED